MSPTKSTLVLLFAVSSVAAMASENPLDFGDLTVRYTVRAIPMSSGDVTLKSAQPQVAAAAAGAALFIKPKIGVRIGGGEWNAFSLNAGADVTFNVPIIPLPAIRVDGEAWARAKDISGPIHGDALSILGVQTFLLGYAGIGPSYYFADNNGNKKSGFGAKLLAGLNIPGSRGLFVEAGLLVGPSPTPIFISGGMRF